MAIPQTPAAPIPNWKAVRDEWLGQLSELRNRIENWAKEIDWSTRRIEKHLEDSAIGEYEAPGLLLQKEFTRLLLEPLGWIGPGAEGSAELYEMPAYDNIASLQFHKGKWSLQCTPPGAPAAGDVLSAAKPLTKKALQRVLEQIKQHAA